MKIKYLNEALPEITDQTILNLCYDANGRIKPLIYKWLEENPLFAPIKDYLNNRYDDIPKEMFSYKEVLFRIKNHIDNRPTCQICGNPVVFVGKTMGGAYPNCYHATCCKEHERLLAKRNEKKTLQDRYGVSHTFNIPEIKAKAEAARQSEEAKEKKKQTMLDRYGYEHTFQNPEVRKKAKESFEKYREEHPGFMTATLKKRANDYAEMLKILRENPGTSIDDYRDIPEYEDYVKAYDRSSETIEKIFTTQKKHGTLNTSNPEEELYNILTEKFNDVIRHYSDNRYKYKCDFYIPSLDLFIEYQGSMFHNRKPYTENYKDELEYIKERNKILKQKSKETITRYDNLISTWVVRDVEKRNTAKKNNLNYLEIYPLYPFNKIVEFIHENYGSDTEGLQLIIGDEK